jgi:hypothetical protein
MHVNSACMFYAPHASIVVWKSQIGAKTLLNLGAGKKLTCFDPLRKGCRIFFNLFFDNYWSSTLSTTFNSQKIILMKYFCFKILQCSPYLSTQCINLAYYHRLIVVFTGGQSSSLIFAIIVSFMLFTVFTLANVYSC